MKFKTLMIIKAIVCITLGIPAVAVPVLFYSFFGLALTPAGAFTAQEYGASLIGNFLLTWFARDIQDSIGKRAILLGMTFYNGIGFVVTMIATLSGLANFMGWGAAGIYLFFTVGFGYHLLKSPKP